MQYSYHGVSREWVKQAFTSFAGHLKSYKSQLTEWMAAATKQMVDNADRCTALEKSSSTQDTKITNLTEQVSAQETKIANLTDTVNNLIAAITDDEIKEAVSATWPLE